MTPKNHFFSKITFGIKNQQKSIFTKRNDERVWKNIDKASPKVWGTTTTNGFKITKIKERLIWKE